VATPPTAVIPAKAESRTTPARYSQSTTSPLAGEASAAWRNAPSGTRRGVREPGAGVRSARANPSVTGPSTPHPSSPARGEVPIQSVDRTEENRIFRQVIPALLPLIQSPHQPHADGKRDERLWGDCREGEEGRLKPLGQAYGFEKGRPADPLPTRGTSSRPQAESLQWSDFRREGQKPRYPETDDVSYYSYQRRKTSPGPSVL
jgi:hypothetical protein